VNELSPVNRPVTLRELAFVFDLTTDQLEHLTKRHEIRPACWIGRTRVYGPSEIRRILSVLTAEAIPA
jgi:hypothetical protein